MHRSLEKKREEAAAVVDLKHFDKAKKIFAAIYG